MTVGTRDELSQRRLTSMGSRVRVLRATLHISQEALAHRAGLHRTVVGFIERGEREPGVLTVWKLADALNVTPAELFA